MPWAQYGEKVQLHWQAQPEQLHLALNRSLPRGLEPSISSKPIDFENEAVKATVQKAESFVSQQDLPSDTAYEFFIFKHKRIPTRNNAHDFFNGLGTSPVSSNHRQAAAPM